MDMKLEVVPIGVTDVDRAKQFYTEKLQFVEDIDQAFDGGRFIQLTPPGSACSIVFGEGVTHAAPGAHDGLMLVVRDIQAAYDALSAAGVDITEPKLESWGTTHCYFSDPDGNNWTVQQKVQA